MSDPNDTQPDDVLVEGKTLENGQPVAPAAAGPFAAGPAGAGPAANKAKGSSVQDLVDEPAKVMRIGTMIRQLLEEVKSAPLDEAARERLAEIHERSIKELEDGLAPELVEELERISLPFPEDATPSDAELRIAQAQLVGWLEGLFHGIQTAIAAQHAAREHAVAQMQLKQLPPGTMIAPGVVIGENGEPQRATAGQQRPGPATPGRPDDPDHGPGQYL
ncbi:bacterial proteasome activator family protein [Pseudarthrobacter sp. BIM B-2242]|uniref:bacterial proteasome activator family protein n=1 Tax=Pseudarthrobacter sp. BIM B-2242 TaxID=2772401 RepID=UPI00168A67E3|nr:bacterial proteasome activator family protein [Pseudarthrobacter sp. BIM B-2242]QOD04108.1 bacterial proteasome activator family protein [Pseudarthrobacter sp. BIM B-2242]